MCNLIGEPSKLKSDKTWEMFPTGMGHQKFKKLPSCSWGKREGGGGVTIFQKVYKFEKQFIIFHLMRTLNQKNL